MRGSYLLYRSRGFKKVPLPTHSAEGHADAGYYLELDNYSADQRKQFFSMWVKIGSNDYGCVVGFDDGYSFWHNVTSGMAWRLADDGTNHNFRNPAAAPIISEGNWYHVCWRVDTGNATEADRFKLWLDGSEDDFSTWGTKTFPTQNSDAKWGNGAATHRLFEGSNSSYDLQGKIYDFHFIDGDTALTLDCDDFGYDNAGTWTPKAYQGSHGSGGCNLNFQDSANLGKDVSGNENNFTNAGPITQSTDVPP